ncbi:MAG TPA: sigma-70 family RNA polymerase sigma factor [Candidatus Binatia bacterium]|nr:sigma-70 family RNA polymerase sigma factor [Candidatus Binatia bacterium]
MESPTPAGDERNLLARCRAGDTRAFSILVERYRDRAYGLALRMVRSPSDAEEVAQDAFVRAWRSLADFRGDSSFGTWLYRIVWRRAVDRAAVLRTRMGKETALEEMPEVGRTAVARESSAADTGDASEWDRITEGLSDAQRAVVTLFYYEDMALKDVARVLDMPEGTVKTHLSRARAALRARYREGNHAM